MIISMVRYLAKKFYPVLLNISLMQENYNTKLVYKILQIIQTTMLVKKKR